MDGLDYGTKGVDELAMFFPIDAECGFSSKSSWRTSSREEQFWSFSAEGCLVRSTFV